MQKMMASGAMHPAGLAKIDAARSDGTWNKLDAVEALDVPPDLAAAFRALPGSGSNFDAFPRSARRGILEWIINARRSDTRAARLQRTATLAARHQRANQWKGPK